MATQEPSPEALALARIALEEIDGLLLQDRPAALARVIDEVRTAAREVERDRMRARVTARLARVDDELARVGDATVNPHDYTPADHLAAVKLSTEGGERG